MLLRIGEERVDGPFGVDRARLFVKHHSAR